MNEIQMKRSVFQSTFKNITELLLLIAQTHTHSLVVVLYMFSGDYRVADGQLTHACDTHGQKEQNMVITGITTQHVLSAVFTSLEIKQLSKMNSFYEK